VLHDPNVPNPSGPDGKPAKFVVATLSPAAAVPVFGGKAKVTPLLDVAHTGDKAIYLGKLEAEPGVEVPRNTHPGVDEILFVAAGTGELTVGSEKFPIEAPEALYIPAGQPHAAKFTGTTGTDKAELVQIFAPAGPEDRYKGANKDTTTKP
jgi:quercetin dioxygenase-like cupin family protein